MTSSDSEGDLIQGNISEVMADVKTSNNEDGFMTWFIAALVPIAFIGGVWCGLSGFGTHYIFMDDETLTHLED